jgi:lysophospholipase L1-like esterase
MNYASIRTRLTTRFAVVAVFAAIMALAGASSASAKYPTSMVAMGDSITQAATTCLVTVTCPENSWATGTNTTVNSIAARLKAQNSSATSSNIAVSGAKITDLKGQANLAVLQAPQLVTIMIGANDACGAIGGVTTAASFRTDVQTVLTTLQNGLPAKSKIVVASIPNLQYLYDLLAGNASARNAWSLLPLCPAMTQNAGSNAAADVARRAATAQRVIDFNTALSDVCATKSKCIWDGLKTYNYKFVPSEIGQLDYFHPSIKGQQTIAREAWPLVPSTF